MVLLVRSGMEVEGSNECGLEERLRMRLSDMAMVG